MERWVLRFMEIKSAIKIFGGRGSKLILIDVHDPLRCQSRLTTFLLKQLQ